MHHKPVVVILRTYKCATHHTPHFTSHHNTHHNDKYVPSLLLAHSNFKITSHQINHITSLTISAVGAFKLVKNAVILIQLTQMLAQVLVNRNVVQWPVLNLKCDVM